MNDFHEQNFNNMNGQYPIGGWYDNSNYARQSYEWGQRRKIKKLSISTGLCMIAFVFIQVVLLVFINLLNLNSYYEENTLFKNALDILMEVFCIFIPFFIAALLSNRENKHSIFNFETPRSVKLFISAIFSGFMICMAANIISGYFQVFLEQFGLNGEVPSFPTPTGAPAILLYIVSISITPALVEEFALRGVVMQPLRKFGDKFAIIISGLVFALLHGNATQTFFAFIVGTTIGYFVVATGSIWTGVAIHFANNFFSVIINILNARNEALATDVYQKVMTLAFIIGIIAFVLFALDKNRVRLATPDMGLTGGQKVASYIFTVPMVAAIVLFLSSIVNMLLRF
jgi:membrane protease YdiL (CAAX protease family)